MEWGTHMRAHIEWIRPATADLRIFEIQLTQPIENFIPGRYCTLVVDGVKRPYSIVSVRGRTIELLIELVEGGALTPKLWKLEAGDELEILPKAKGIFTLDSDFKNHVFVATVTGIAPFMSMLYEYLSRRDDENRFFVFYGASYQKELVYHEELLRLARTYPDKLKYVATISRPDEEQNATWVANPNEGREIGRVNDVLPRYIEECPTALLSEEEFDCHSALLYACGHDGMMESIKEKFSPFGWDIKEEAFWH